MKLLIILACFGIERYFRIGAMLSRFKWFEAYLNFFQRLIKSNHLWSGWIAVITAMLPIVIIISAVYYLTAHWLYGLIGLTLGSLILLYCLGPKDLYDQLQNYLNAAEGSDEQAKQKALAELLPSDIPADKHEISREVSKLAINEFQTRIFGVIFWFVLFGPVGAVIYRLAEQLAVISQKKDSAFAMANSQASQCFNLVNWLPARAVFIIYSLVGDFSRGLSAGYPFLTAGLNSNQKMIQNTAFAAMGIDLNTNKKANLQENQDVLAMLDRTLIVVLVITAIFTLGAWIY